MWNKKVSLLTILFFVSGYASLYAQGRGQIKGVVIDATTNEPLIGVNVGLQGTSIGSPTDIDGLFTISRVPAGTYTLVASSIGYENYESQVEVAAGETLDITITMRQQTVEGEEVIVSAQAQGQQQAINQQLQSDNIVNVVSEAKISEMPDFNAAQAIGRLPGVSTLKSSGEANKVVIRGLSPKYNSIEVEGIKLSSTGSSQIGVSSLGNTSGSLNNDRSVDLTMVSPYMVRMISVYKSLTPDMNANSIGGTVNMELREAPSGPHWSAMYQQGYTAKSNSLSNFRAVLSGSNRFFEDKLGVYALANFESYDRDADNLNAGYISDDIREDSTGRVPVNVSSVSLNRHIENRERFGGNLILDYKLPSGSIKAINMFARFNSDYTDYNQQFIYSGAGSGRINWTLRDGFRTIDQQLNSLRLDYDFDLIQVDASVSYSRSRNSLPESPYITFNQTGAIATGSVESNTRPEDLTSFVNYSGDSDIVLLNGSLFSSEYEESKLVYKADFEVPFNLGNKASGFIKFGGQFDDQKITNDQETPYVGFDANSTLQNELLDSLSSQFGITRGSSGRFAGSEFTSTDNDLYDPFLGDDFGDYLYAGDVDLFNNIIDYLQGNPRFDATTQSNSSNPGGWFDGSYQQLANDYQYDEHYYATYLMSKINFLDFMIIGGVRYEKVESEYFAYNGRDRRDPATQVMYETTSTNDNEFFLPMGQIKYSPFEWMDIRYAYTQTLARPDYSQLSPKFTVTQGGNIYAGNPDLKPAEATNHDLSLSFNGNKLGLFSVGVFYKNVEGFTRNTSYTVGSASKAAGVDSLDRFSLLIDPTANQDYTLYYSINNPYDATIKGLELELQTNLWYLPKPLDGLVVGLNYSYIESETKYPYYNLETDFSTRPPTAVFIDSSRTGRLINQPTHIFNSYLGFDYKGFMARVSFIYQGDEVSYIGNLPFYDGITQDYFRIDFSARQKLPFATSAEIFVDITNLNDENNESRQTTINGFTNIQNYGLTANVGLRVRY